MHYEKKKSNEIDKEGLCLEKSLLQHTNLSFFFSFFLFLATNLPNSKWLHLIKKMTPFCHEMYYKYIPCFYCSVNF